MNLFRWIALAIVAYVAADAIYTTVRARRANRPGAPWAATAADPELDAALAEVVADWHLVLDRAGVDPASRPLVAWVAIDAEDLARMEYPDAPYLVVSIRATELTPAARRHLFAVLATRHLTADAGDPAPTVHRGLAHAARWAGLVFVALSMWAGDTNRPDPFLLALGAMGIGYFIAARFIGGEWENYRASVADEGARWIFDARLTDETAQELDRESPSDGPLCWEHRAESSADWAARLAHGPAAETPAK